MARGPIAQSAIDLVRLIGSKIVGKSEVSAAGKLNRGARKSQGADETARANRELLAGSAVVGGVVALIVGLFILEASGGTGSNGPVPQPIMTLRANDAEALRSAFFGATPHVIECVSDVATGKSLLREAAAESRLPDAVVAASLDCEQMLSRGGASTMERFKLTPAAPSAPPLLLKAGHGLLAPTPLRLGKATSVQSLVRHLKLWSQPHVALLNSTLDLRRHCLSRPLCLLLLTKGTVIALGLNPDCAGWRLGWMLDGYLVDGRWIYEYTLMTADSHCRQAPAAAKSAVLRSVASVATRELGLATLNRRTHAAVGASSRGHARPDLPPHAAASCRRFTPSPYALASRPRPMPSPCACGHVASPGADASSPSAPSSCAAVPLTLCRRRCRGHRFAPSPDLHLPNSRDEPRRLGRAPCGARARAAVGGGARLPWRRLFG